jgi:hypothetical protein
MSKQPMTEERLYPILKSAHMIGVIAEIIKVEHRTAIFDTKFKNPNTNNHASKIVQSADQIQTDLAFTYKCMKREDLTYEYALQYHRLLDHFIDLGIERTEHFMDLVDKGKSEAALLQEEAA